MPSSVAKAQDKHNITDLSGLRSEPLTTRNKIWSVYVISITFPFHLGSELLSQYQQPSGKMLVRLLQILWSPVRFLTKMTQIWMFILMACKNLAGMSCAPPLSLGSLLPSLYSTMQLILTLTTHERPTGPWAGLHYDGLGKRGIMFRTLP